MLLGNCYLSIFFWQRISINQLFNKHFNSTKNLVKYLYCKVYSDKVDKTHPTLFFLKPIISIIIFTFLVSYFGDNQDSLSRIYKDNYHWVLITGSVITISLITRTISISILFLIIFSFTLPTTMSTVRLN